jgi:pseudouridine-5'-phosphate glycosidase
VRRVSRLLLGSKREAGAVVAIAPPEELLGAAGVVEQALAESAGVEGPAATPVTLARIAELTGGRSVEVNVRVIVNNAAVAADCAVAWVREGRRGAPRGQPG